jgi:hypothetical protein
MRVRAFAVQVWLGDWLQLTPNPVPLGTSLTQQG